MYEFKDYLVAHSGLNLNGHNYPIETWNSDLVVGKFIINGLNLYPNDAINLDQICGVVTKFRVDESLKDYIVLIDFKLFNGTVLKQETQYIVPQGFGLLENGVVRKYTLQCFCIVGNRSFELATPLRII